MKAKTSALALKSGEGRTLEMRPQGERAKRGEKSGEKSGALLQVAIKRVKALPLPEQNAIAEGILAGLLEGVAPTTKRFQELVEAKYTRRMTAKETSELTALEKGFTVSDEAFYGPMLAELRARKAESAKRREPKAR